MEKKCFECCEKKTAPIFTLKHVGINAGPDGDALEIAKLFCNAFGFDCKPGKSSVFAADHIEVMHGKGLGRCGHIAFETASIPDALEYLASAGVESDESTAKYDASGNLKAIYVKGDFGGFAVHLVQKK